VTGAVCACVECAIASVTAPCGYGVPVTLAGPSGGAACAVVATARSDGALPQYVVSLAVDLFPWDEIETLAVSLQQHGYRLVAAEGHPGEVCDLDDLDVAGGSGYSADCATSVPQCPRMGPLFL
jgi:hypothetical protein